MALNERTTVSGTCGPPEKHPECDMTSTAAVLHMCLLIPSCRMERWNASRKSELEAQSCDLIVEVKTVGVDVLRQLL